MDMSMYAAEHNPYALTQLLLALPEMQGTVLASKVSYATSIAGMDAHFACIVLGCR